jgi:signal transduction histidine kinase
MQKPESCAINTFFDLAQELNNLEQTYLLSVLILNIFFQYKAELYMKDEEGNLVMLTPPIEQHRAEDKPEIPPRIWTDGTHCHIPLYGKNAFALIRNEHFPISETPIGMLVLYVNRMLKNHELLFLEKYATRVGFCLESKIMALRNERHVLFLRKLAHDIGHNVITPGMRLKLTLNHLENKIAAFGKLLQNAPDTLAHNDIRELHQKMVDQTKMVMDTFKNSTLFLESLLRQSHFDLGHYVLRSSRFDICKLVVSPQFDRYRSIFDEKNLHVDENQPFCPPDPCLVEADHGLISQVLANLLSNAAKYSTPTAPDQPSEIRCDTELALGAFEGNGQGVKVSVFSSGPHIPPAEAERLFDDNYRASNSADQYGTGHGLFFVREIIGEHKGVSGYTPTKGGNTFFFILPSAS